jgi:hypothetical protein
MLEYIVENDSTVLTASTRNQAQHAYATPVRLKIAKLSFMAWHRLVLEDNEGHLASGLFRTFHGNAKFESKQLRSHGMSMSLSKDIFNLALSVSVVPALFGVVFSGASSGRCGLKHAQTHSEQGVLRSVNIRTGALQRPRIHNFVYTARHTHG